MAIREAQKQALVTSTCSMSTAKVPLSKALDLQDQPVSGVDRQEVAEMVTGSLREKAQRTRFCSCRTTNQTMIPVTALNCFCLQPGTGQ